MHQGKLRLHRPALPKELRNPESELSQLVNLVGDLRVGTDLAHAGEKKTRDFIRRACHSYKPSTQDMHHILCRSGEVNGQPYRGEACAQCHVGMFTKNLVFLGEIHPSAKAPQPAK